MLVHEYLERSAGRFPDKEALVVGDVRLTYRDLDIGANRLARALRESDVEYSDRVAILMDNIPETVISIWGILRMGAIFLVINPTTRSRKISYREEDFGPLLKESGGLHGAQVRRVERFAAKNDVG
ncbi:MAG: AMP-binding protein [Candidatus Krumholzibacteria bacterium]|nr:AMP-binding protein [Candidatus Krumholzibacteria bacterium]